MKKALALKKYFTSKKVRIGVTVVAALALIAAIAIYPQHLKNSRDKAAQILLQQIALAEIASVTPCGSNLCDYRDRYAFTNGASETAEEAVTWLTEFGFRPDPSVAFHIMSPAFIDDVTTDGFIVFTAHNSVGSSVYIYDSSGVSGPSYTFREVRENDVYGEVTIINSVADLFCYQYDPSNSAAPVVKKPGPVKFAPDPRDKVPARMIVTGVAE